MSLCILTKTDITNIEIYLVITLKVECKFYCIIFFPRMQFQPKCIKYSVTEISVTRVIYGPLFLTNL